MFQLSSLIIITSLSLADTKEHISHKNIINKSPTLFQTLQTNNTLIQEQHEEIIRSVLIKSIEQETW